MPLGSSLFTCLGTSSRRKLSHMRAAHRGSAPSLLSPFPSPCCGCGTALGASCTLPCPQVWSRQREVERVKRPSLPRCLLCSAPCLSWRGGLSRSCLSQATTTREDTKRGDGVVVGAPVKVWVVVQAQLVLWEVSVFYQEDNHIGWWLILQARRPNLPVLSNLTWSY